MLLLAGLACSGISWSQAQADSARKNSTGAPLTTLASIQPNKIQVDVEFELDGKLSTMPPCPTDSGSKTCSKPQVQAEHDAVEIKYSILNGFTAAPTDKLTLKACWAPLSQDTRPWRKSNPVVALSKQCKIMIAKGLKPFRNPTAGFKWEPDESVPSATYFVRAFVMRNATTLDGEISPETYPVAFGDSDFFGVKGINSIPTSMKIASGLCICVGPIMFGTYVSLTYLRKSKV